MNKSVSGGEVDSGKHESFTGSQVEVSGKAESIANKRGGSGVTKEISNRNNLGEAKKSGSKVRCVLERR